MRLNKKATSTLIYTIVIMLGFIVFRVFYDVSYYIYTPLFFISLAVGTFMIVYYQKTGKPVCKSCRKNMKLVDKKLINQDEEIRYGQFVFIYKYEYEYQCPHCKEVAHINKTIKK